jgi:hypothetical protein
MPARFKLIFLRHQTDLDRPQSIVQRNAVTEVVVHVTGVTRINLRPFVFRKEQVHRHQMSETTGGAHASPLRDHVRDKNRLPPSKVPSQDGTNGLPLICHASGLVVCWRCSVAWKFLGFSFTAGPDIKRVIARKSLHRFKREIAKCVIIETTMEELAPICELAQLFRLLPNRPMPESTAFKSAGVSSRFTPTMATAYQLPTLSTAHQPLPLVKHGPNEER